ncbi:MAG: hypothetical protein ACK5Q5_21465 [Planctomycetaceae bacterium]
MSESVFMSAGPTTPPPLAVDLRLYLPEHDRFRVAIMSGVDREYCYQKSPGQDFYHLIVPGEIYVDSGDEKFCFNCALRRGIVTPDRLFWQKRTI